MMITLRPYQQTASNIIRNYIIDAFTNNNIPAKGRIIMPTGSGKTVQQADVLKFMHTLKHDNFIKKNTNIHLVLAPRILLSKQLSEEYRSLIDPDGKMFRIIAFHSGHCGHEPDYTKIKWQEKSTTRPDDLKTEYIKAIETNMHLVVFSTYHSCNKLANINFDTIIADESQYCVSEDFNNAIKSLTGKVKLFFTATEKHTASNNGRGLNNINTYGDILFQITPADLINQGYIVKPALHVMHCDTLNEDKSIIHEIIEIAKKQDELTQPELNFSKILFAMKGTDDVKTIEDNISKIKLSLSDHDIFTITSKTGAKINGRKLARDQFLSELKDCKNALIFHYDILSEGIDIDGITGVALLRNMGLAKLLQTIGRSVRPYKPNPSLKKRALISVPVVNGNDDDAANVEHYITAIRMGGFDISAEDVIETGNSKHLGDSQQIDDAYEELKLNTSLFSIENIFHKIKDNEFWSEFRSKSVTDQIDMLF